MSPSTVTGSRSPWRRRQPLFPDLALLGERADLTPQAPRLVPLLAGQALGTALIDLDLNASSCAATAARPKLSREPEDRLAAAAKQLDRLTAKLDPIRGLA
jgi:hypothetical protein